MSTHCETHTPSSVLGSDDIGISRPFQDFWYPISSCPPSWLREVVVHVGSVIGKGVYTRPRPENWMGDRNCVGLDKVTIILQPGKTGQCVPDGEDSKLESDMRGWQLSFLWEKLARALQANPVIMEVVGLEGVNGEMIQDPALVPSLSQEGLVKDEIREKLQEMGWSLQDARRGVERIRCLKKVDYDGRKAEKNGILSRPVENSTSYQ
jgi:hypothetical protein